jgi:hypothetical protein
VLGLVIDPEDGSSALLLHVGKLLLDKRHRIPEGSSFLSLNLPFPLSVYELQLEISVKLQRTAELLGRSFCVLSY